jgi:PadR family transcriptional regulator, regulatory protein PadR
MIMFRDFKKNMPHGDFPIYILLSLLHGPQHGYAILKEAQLLSQGRLKISVTTLYSSINCLLEQGWIESIDSGSQLKNSRYRKEYKLSQMGFNTLETKFP